MARGSASEKFGVVGVFPGPPETKDNAIKGVTNVQRRLYRIEYNGQRGTRDQQERLLDSASCSSRVYGWIFRECRVEMSSPENPFSPTGRNRQDCTTENLPWPTEEATPPGEDALLRRSVVRSM